MYAIDLSLDVSRHMKRLVARWAEFVAGVEVFVRKEVQPLLSRGHELASNHARAVLDGGMKLASTVGVILRDDVAPAADRAARYAFDHSRAGIAHGAAALSAYGALLRRRPLDGIDLALDRISRSMKIVAAAGLFGLSLFILADVLSRSIFNIPLIGLKEMIANSIATIAFLQLPYTVRIGGMLRAEILDSKLPPHLREALKRLAWALGGLLFAIVAYAGFDPMIGSWMSGEYEGEGGFRVPSYPVRSMIVIGSALGAANFVMLALRGDGAIRE